VRDDHPLEMSLSTTHQRVPVTEGSQPSAVRFAVRDLAGRAGFDADTAHRAGLVATELATNLVKHATGGEILMRMVAPHPCGEIEILSIDRGPGIRDVAQALSDGHSTSGTPGTGLGAIRRLSDDFAIYSTGQGTVAVVRVRWDRRRSAEPQPFAFGAVSVPVSGETQCGDAWSVHGGPDFLVALVADGLGHGAFAADAAHAVVDAVRSRPADTPADALASAHDAVRHTRGAAAAIAEIRSTAGVVNFAGVGNIAGAIITHANVRHAVSHSGTLGHEARHFKEYRYPWEDVSLLVMHSDGLKTHWSLDAYPGIRRQHPALVAALLYRDFSRGCDDVTVVVARRTE
jgi:anti-sigma regulatory factor (Ser/Thr protein kinase)